MWTVSKGNENKRNRGLKMKFNKKEIIRLWGNGLPLRVNYKDYKVYKMSYGQYFLEPANIEVRETE